MKFFRGWMGRGGERAAFRKTRMGRRRNRETGMVRRRRADGTGPSSWTAREKKSAFAIDRRAPGWTYLALAAHVPQVQRLVRARGRHRGAVGGELHARHRVLVALQQHDGRVEGRRPLVRPGLELLPQRGLRHSQRRGAPLAGLLLLRDEAELGILGRGRRGGFTLARHRAVGSGDDPPRFLGLSRTDPHARHRSRCSTTRVPAAFPRLLRFQSTLEAAHRGCQRATKRTESTRPKERPPGRLSAMASAAGSRYGRRRAPLTAGTLAKLLVTASRHRVSASRPSSPVVSPPDRPPPLSSPPTLPH